MTGGRRRSSSRVVHYSSDTYRALLQIVAANIRRLRTSRGWTQQQAGGAMGVSMQAWPSMEGGRKNLTLVSVARIADALCVDASELFDPTTVTVRDA